MKPVHAKCLATTEKDGHTLVCWKSPEHTVSRYGSRREHYDPSCEERWYSHGDKGEDRDE